MYYGDGVPDPAKRNVHAIVSEEMMVTKETVARGEQRIRGKRWVDMIRDAVERRDDRGKKYADGG